jgi:hypothetical protein
VKGGGVGWVFAVAEGPWFLRGREFCGKEALGFCGGGALAFVAELPWGLLLWRRRNQRCSVRRLRQCAEFPLHTTLAS